MTSSLPLVEPLVEPRRFSQTILRHANYCKRSAYLYQKYGSRPAHALDRGSIYHLAKAKILKLILEQYMHNVNNKNNISSNSIDKYTAEHVLEETLYEHPELTIPLHERNELRIMMTHLVNGLRINPAHIVAIEQKVVLSLEEYTISGILDLAAIDGHIGLVRDSKTSWALPSQTEFAGTFQGRLYAVLLMFGNPVKESPCPSCNGKGCVHCARKGKIEEFQPPLGEHLQTIDVGEIYPRFLSCTLCGNKTYKNNLCSACNGPMGMPEPHLVLNRTEVLQLRSDIKQQCKQLTHAFQTRKFSAIPGSHCSECPMEPECPLPANLRRYAGTIRTDVQAKEAAEWHTLWASRLKTTWKELKLYCKINGPLYYGTNLVAEFSKISRWDSNRHEQKPSTVFRQRTLTSAERNMKND